VEQYEGFVGLSVFGNRGFYVGDFIFFPKSIPKKPFKSKFLEF
jgi:hypothetical protein